MKAVMVRAFAPYDQAKRDELAAPLPGPSEAVIDTTASEAESFSSLAIPEPWSNS